MTRPTAEPYARVAVIHTEAGVIENVTMGRYQQSPQDLHQHLDEQLSFVQSSLSGYDAGNEAEAKRLAVHVRVLVHDTRNSVSLLSQLNLKGVLRFYDTATPRVRSATTSYVGLTATTIGGGPPKYLPLLDTNPRNRRRVPFDDWWNSIVISDMERRTITRERVVLSLANQDGGAHVDPELREVYAAVSRRGSLGRKKGDGKNWEDMLGAERATMRQIAHEMLLTLVPGYAVAPPKGNHEIEMLDVRPIFAPPPGSGKWGRNELCFCGSGMKYKRCCLV